MIPGFSVTLRSSTATSWPKRRVAPSSSMRGPEAGDMTIEVGAAGVARACAIESAVPRPFPPVKPPPIEEQDGATYPQLVALMRRLLAPDGCPWDQKQTYRSLRRYVLEEAAEVVDAIDHGDFDELQAELGDLLLQVVFLTELAQREKRFAHDDVVEGIVSKLVRRHPHVFADAAAGDAKEALANWEQIKAEERKAKGRGDEGVLDSIPRSLPSLVRAQRLGEKASTMGFDWPDVAGPRAKIEEELVEVQEAQGDAQRTEQEVGDLLFAVVNLARHLDVDADLALGGANDRFHQRFGHVEARVNTDHGGFAAGKVPLEQLESYWQEAKENG